MQLVERHIINENHEYYKELDNLCFLSKNLYNSTIWRQQQEYEKDKKYHNYNVLNRIFVDENQVDYRALPAKVSNQTMMMVDSAYKSFFEKRKNGDKTAKKPKYLHKTKGRQTVFYEKGAISFKKRKGYIHLSKTNIFIKSKIPHEKINFVRVNPKGNHFVIEVGYKIDDVEEKKNDKKYASIDLGVNNLITLASNVDKPIIINGRPVKSINRFYNKKIARLKSQLSVGLYSSKQIQNLYKNRKNKIDDYMHKASRFITDYLVSNQINTLVVGYNSGWKQDVDMGKKNNQTFSYIPYLRLINLLEYKCEMVGIKVEVREESYTSKCSFLDNEEVCEHDKYSGKRVKRGLYVASDGRKINADVNGALNILKKYLISKVAWDSQVWEDLVGASSTPNVLKIKSFN